MQADSFTSSPSATQPSRSGARAPSWLREPLLHFVLLGGLLFSVDAAVKPVDESHVIVVGPEVDSEAIELFEESNGRPPNEKELRALHQVWLDNEVLYREGLALQVDRGDPAIRERVIFKALSVVDANVKLPPIDDEQLRQWFESHRSKYDEPARYDFEEAALANHPSEQDVRRFVAQLNAGAPGDADAGLRVFKGRPYANLLQSYGPEFAEALVALPPGQWQALPTRDGWRAIRLVAQTPAMPANFDSMRNVALQDWKDETAAKERTDAVRELAKKYDIRFETPTP